MEDAEVEKLKRKKKKKREKKKKRKKVLGWAPRTCLKRS
jgi:hypothetical protein